MHRDFPGCGAALTASEVSAEVAETIDRVAAAGVPQRLVQLKMRVNEKMLAYALSILRRTDLPQNVYGNVSNLATLLPWDVQMLDWRTSERRLERKQNVLMELCALMQ